MAATALWTEDKEAAEADEDTDDMRALAKRLQELSEEQREALAGLIAPPEEEKAL